MPFGERRPFEWEDLRDEKKLGNVNRAAGRARPANGLGLSPDGRLLLATRIARLFAYGFLSVVLALYLAQVGLDERQIGLLLTLTLAGDTGISLWITTQADRIGRRRMLLAGAGLMVFAGALFAVTANFYLLLFAATVGVISPSGNEVGPFLSIEQATLSQLLPGPSRTRVFAWYNLVGSFATALGALAGGGLAQALQSAGAAPLASYRTVVLGYAALGFVLLGLFTRLSPVAEVAASPGPAPEQPAGGFLGLHRSRSTVFRLAVLFSLDAFAGGFVIQSLVAYWFHVRFGVEPGVLGSIFFGANILAGISALSAAWVANRIGLINTMVFTHLPSNVLLMLVPLMPSLPLAIAVLLLRFSISQMDVPTRQSYTMAVVAPDERSAASGVTGIARTIGASLAPVFTGVMLANPALLSLPFFLSGGLKIVYDLALYRSFKSHHPPEEQEISS
ncbi:MAG TPA: MFS transporter [Anaerolineales bacterium]